MRVSEVLALARAQGVVRLDAQLLLAHHLQRERSWLLAHDDAEVDDAVLSAYRIDLRRRADAVPLSYLTQQREFYGLSLHVSPAVLVPRPETEGLVDWALEILRRQSALWPRPQLADLGTGSGAIALAVKKHRPQAEVTATDDSEAALAVARSNAMNLGLALGFAAGSWWQALATRRFHLAVANPPYIAAGDPHLRALRHEPQHALTPGGDGLSAIEHIVAGARDHLHAGGWLLLEHGHDQSVASRGGWLPPAWSTFRPGMTTPECRAAPAHARPDV